MKKSVSIDVRRLYGDLSWTWPIISPVEEYEEEGELIARVIREESLISVKTLLDLGCGGGHVDFYLKKYFTVTAADISEPMLALAARLNPEVTCLMGDMRTMRLDQRFDAVVIHDAINYMLTSDDLRAAFQTAYEHLKPGGSFITFAEVIAESFQQNKTVVTSRSRGEVEIIFIENYYDPNPKDTTYEGTFLYLIRKRGGLAVEIDHHLGGIFPLETWHRLLERTGFEVKELNWVHSEFAEGESVPLLVCTRPS
jgi:SAM-dependent methyltransferase